MRKMPAFVIFFLVLIFSTANAQRPVNRVSAFEPGRVLREFSQVRQIEGNKIEVAGAKEITAQRIKEIPDFNTSRKIYNLDEEIKRRFKNDSEEGRYQTNRNESSGRLNNVSTVWSSSLPMDKYPPIDGQENTDPEKLGLMGIFRPKKSVDKSRTPQADISWKAFEAMGDCSADVNLGVSETHVVVTSRTNVGFFDRAGNKQKDIMYIGEFFNWLGASTGVNGFFDTRCLFDPYRKRFWIGTLGYSSADTVGGIKGPHVFCCAVSKTQNPMDGWYSYYWYSGYGEKHLHDYPTLGISQDVFVETNIAVTDDKKYYNNICIFDAQSLADGQFKPGWRFWGWKNPANGTEAEFHITPLIQHGSSPYTYLLGKEGNNVILYGIKDPLKPTQSVSAWNIDFSNTPFTLTMPAPQKDNTRELWFENMSNFIFSATYRNNNIYFIMTDARDWKGDGNVQTSLRMVRVRNYNGTYWYDINRVFGSNNKFDDQPGDNIFYGFPAIAVNAHEDIVTGYCRSGKSLYPEIRASVWRHDGLDILPSRLIKNGEAPYRFDALAKPDWPTLPWADCSGAVADPSDDYSVWIATSYATTAAQNNWGVWVARVKMW